MIIDKQLSTSDTEVLKTLVNDMLVFGSISLVYNQFKDYKHYALYGYYSELERYAVQVLTGW